MTYEETLDTGKVEEHPMEGFKEMANVSTGGDFGDQFAQLINELTTNVIIPTEDKDELKQWAAEHAKGEDIYAKIDGGLRIAEVPNDASGPEDVAVKSVGGGGLEELAQEGDDGQVIAVNDGGLSLMLLPEHVESRTINSGADTIDVSEINYPIRVFFRGESGESGSDGDSRDGGAGGQAKELEVDVDLTDYDEIEVVLADGRNGYDEGEEGGTSCLDGGDGAGSSVLKGYNDGDDEVIIEVSGGGGGGGGYSSGCGGGDVGGDGGGTTGGDGANSHQSSGGNGGYTANNDVYVVAERESRDGSHFIFNY